MDNEITKEDIKRAWEWVKPKTTPKAPKQEDDKTIMFTILGIIMLILVIFTLTWVYDRLTEVDVVYNNIGLPKKTNVLAESFIKWVEINMREINSTTIKKRG